MTSDTGGERSAPAAAAAETRPRTPYQNYLLTVLLVILAFNYMDRMVLGLVMQDIKGDLNLTDSQLGFLSGIAFALFYAVMGIPLARWADRGNRVTLISLTAALWSAATALCGAAGSFIQLLLIRIGVAVGEAGCHPTALSLISDVFTRAERPRAVARYMLGIPLALFVGNFAAGWLNQWYGWRVTFVVLGLPGLAVAALAAFTLKEPRRAQLKSTPAQTSPEPPPLPSSAALGLKDTLRLLWSNTAYRHLLFCFSIWGFFGLGILQWLPAFFIRSHGLQTGELGTAFAVIYGTGGLLGTYLGGEVAARYAANDEALQLKMVAIVYAALAFLGGGVYLASGTYSAFAVLAITAVAGAATNGPLFAAAQTVVPAHVRAMSVALLYFFCNLVGMGLGPLTVGLLSDALRPWLGEESLRYVLLAFSPGYLWCAWHLWQAGRSARHAVLKQGTAVDV